MFFFSALHFFFMNTKHIKGYFHRKRKQKQFHVDAAVEKDPASSPRLVGAAWMAPDHLKLELRPPPVTPFGVVADRIARSHADPLRNRSILLLFFRQDLFYLQCFVRRHVEFYISRKTRKRNLLFLKQKLKFQRS